MSSHKSDVHPTEMSTDELLSFVSLDMQSALSS